MYIQIIYKNIIIPSRLLQIKPESRGYFNFINNDWIVPEQWGIHRVQLCGKPGLYSMEKARKWYLE